MGCATSKRVEATVVSDVIYRPAPSSFALFDISTIEEPWLKSNIDEEENEKVGHVPAPILEKLNTFELANDGPHSWSEVSKALEELKPSLHSQKPALPEPVKTEVQQDIPISKPTHFTKSNSIHTLEELDKKLSSKPTDQLKKSESMTAMDQHELKRVVLKKADSKKTESQVGGGAPEPPIIYEGVRPVKENMFIIKDRMERGKDGMLIKRRDPLSEYPEKCPPDGAESVVLYTTTLRGVRRTFEDCNRIRSAIELHGVLMDERDVSLHGQFLNELRELLGEGACVPRLFIKGRYIGGVDEVMELNELGKLGKLLNLVGKNREPCSVCEGCGGTRFLPCLECGGSCKVVIGDKKERCTKCNENGLVQCPVCH
ncbi:hypothetical protein AQUCO_03700197v1 [Aquilegia coerulea]|uniref:Glutaredoxin domain-containing protein n=1 Tax=Aquilegia coerulea TaxID=218851 RepID=A0A2G5CU19_AQUCA|nr:hypothetical protein AQUCO_03700197v1 [Aquilegia coerulea]